MKKFAWLLVVLTLTTFLLLLGYSLTFGTLTVAKNLINTTKEKNPLEHDIFEGYFAIKDLKYYDRFLVESLNASDDTMEICKSNMTSEVVVINLLLDNEKLPSHCEIFVDMKYADEFDIIDPPCYPQCIQGESIFAVSIKRQDFKEDHHVRICCDTICHEDWLEALC